MGSDDKDRLKKTLDEREHAAEESFFAAREKEALRRLKERSSATAVGGDCPRCGMALVAVKHHGVSIEECPNGHGMWLDHGQIAVIADRERDSWLGRLFHMPRPQR